MVSASMRMLRGLDRLEGGFFGGRVGSAFDRR